MKPLPQTEEELKKEAGKFGYFGKLGCFRNISKHFESPRKELPGLIVSSKIIGRSSNQASILVVGTSGAGKTSTINNLFNVELDTNSIKSDTRVTTEYNLQSDYAKFDVGGLTLGVIDTPGMNDTDGLKQDACNIYSVDTFFKVHPHLKGCYPNLIFILLQAIDNRVSGPNSNLAKTIKGLKLLNVVDDKHPNLVGILTHCCSLPGKGDSWTKKIEQKKNALQEEIFKYLHITAPVIAIENMFEAYELQRQGDYRQLPNGKLQPKNLYNACLELLEQNRDGLGLLILNACFEKTKCIESSHKVSATIANKGFKCPEEEAYLKELEKISVDEDPDFLVKAATEYCEKEKLPPNEDKQIKICVQNLKSLGVSEIEDLKYIRPGNVVPENMLTRSSKVFLKKLKVNSPAVMVSSSVIGKGYNLIFDKSVPTEIFHMDFIDSGYGVIIPQWAKIEKTGNAECIMGLFEDKDSMVQARMNQLNIDMSIPSEKVSFQPRAGINLKNSSDSMRHSFESSFLYEERVFYLKMANFKDLKVQGTKFTKDFKDAVERLPLDYRRGESENIFRNFFQRWGQFIIVGAFAGGSVEAKKILQKGGDQADSFVDVKLGLTAAFNLGVGKIGGNIAYENQKKESSSNEFRLEHCIFKFQGGDRIFWQQSTIENKEDMKKWRLSILDKPEMLQTEMDLEPISTVVGCVDERKEKATRRAIEDCIGSEIKGMKKKTEEPKQDAIKRKETTKDPKGIWGCPIF